MTLAEKMAIFDDLPLKMREFLSTAPRGIHPQKARQYIEDARGNVAQAIAWLKQDYEETE